MSRVRRGQAERCFLSTGEHRTPSVVIAVWQGEAPCGVVCSVALSTAGEDGDGGENPEEACHLTEVRTVDALHCRYLVSWYDALRACV